MTLQQALEANPLTECIQCGNDADFEVSTDPEYDITCGNCGWMTDLLPRAMEKFLGGMTDDQLVEIFADPTLSERWVNHVKRVIDHRVNTLSTKRHAKDCLCVTCTGGTDD